jgi:hypothetical protein
VLKVYLEFSGVGSHSATKFYREENARDADVIAASAVRADDAGVIGKEDRLKPCYQTKKKQQR